MISFRPGVTSKSKHALQPPSGLQQRKDRSPQSKGRRYCRTYSERHHHGAIVTGKYTPADGNDPAMSKRTIIKALRAAGDEGVHSREGAAKTASRTTLGQMSLRAVLISMSNLLRMDFLLDGPSYTLLSVCLSVKPSCSTRPMGHPNFRRLRQRTSARRLKSHPRWTPALAMDDALAPSPERGNPASPKSIPPRLSHLEGQLAPQAIA